MIRISIAMAGVFSAAVCFAAEDYTIHTFKKIRVSEHFWSEGAHYGDFNHDGKMDVVSGPYWWEGPNFQTAHEYSAATKSFTRTNSAGEAEKIPGYEGALGKNNAYSENFFAFTYDFNKDGWDDILIYGFPGKEAIWYENPKGKPAEDGSEHWKAHKALDVVDGESPAFTDVTGDGKPEIVCFSRGYAGYAEPDANDPGALWTFHNISPKGRWERYTHGFGVGDVNGDGKADILEAGAWWEQPKSLDGDPEWVKHPQQFGTGGAQMHVYDVNGDGLNDVITSLAAHGYGLAWYEQVREGDEITFKQHTFMNKEPKDNKYGVKFSQLHAIDLIDMDGDGLNDIVTGKRFWAHGSTGDAEPNAPAVLYWFKLVRGADKSADFVPHLIDNDSGIGTQVIAGDLNGDKLPDIVVGNKKGTFVHLHQVKKVSRAEWEKAQPKPLAVATVSSVK